MTRNRRAGRAGRPSGGPRGGLTSKVHLAADRRVPASLAGHQRRAPPRLAGLRAGHGRIRIRRRSRDPAPPPEHVLGNHAYSSRVIRPPAATPDSGHHRRSRPTSGPTGCAAPARVSGHQSSRPSATSSATSSSAPSKAHGLPCGGHPPRQTGLELPSKSLRSQGKLASHVCMAHICACQRAYAGDPRCCGWPTRMALTASVAE